MKKSLTALMISTLALASGYARAADVPANNCEIFIKSVGLAPSSHSSMGMYLVVKVRWLGDGEYIQNVGMRGHQDRQDLGNDPTSCYMSIGSVTGPWSDIWPTRTQSYPATAYGEYLFTFNIRSGSVVSQCPGYYYSTVGAFFVQTNKNTYWLNPQMDASENFVFDNNGANLLQEKVGLQLSPTTRDDLRYYNPRSCQ